MLLFFQIFLFPFSFFFFFTEPFQYTAWEFNIEDYEEETEDFQAEAEIDEEIEEGEEEEEEVWVSGPSSLWGSRENIFFPLPAPSHGHSIENVPIQSGSWHSWIPGKEAGFL